MRRTRMGIGLKMGLRVGLALLVLACSAPGPLVIGCPCALGCNEQYLDRRIKGTGGHGFALLVGLNDYGVPGMPSLDLSYPERAVREMAATLCRNGYHVATLTGSQVTRKRILDRLEEIGRHGQGNNLNRVVFYFIGHGIRSSEGGLLLLLRHDPGSVENHLDTRELQDRLVNSGMSQKVVLLDACFGGNFRPTVLKVPEGRHALLRSRSYNQITTAADRLAYESGLSRVLLEGIQGKAAEQGLVTLGSLERYLQRRIDAEYSRGDSSVAKSDFFGDGSLALAVPE